MKKYLSFFLLSLLFSFLLWGCSGFEYSGHDEKLDSPANQQNLSNLKKDLEEGDQRKLSQRLENLSLGETDFWQNPNSNATYTVTPTQNFSSTTYPYCRYFRLVVTQNDSRELVYGSACRQESGNWQIV